MPGDKKKAAFYTLGCRVNQYETRAAEEEFEKNGFEIGSFDEKCDVYVINTCTVTAESDRKSRQIIRRARKIGGEKAVILAMGCMVQTAPEQAKKISGLDFAVGTRNKMTVVSKAIELLEHKNSVSDVCPTDFDETDSMEKMSISASDTTRAFLKISDGCQNNCSYCIIPTARGPVCSKSQAEVCAEVEKLCQNGWREVVLTGIETAAYGKDFGNTDLSELICEVNALECGLRRIRLGSLEPTFIKEKTVKNLAGCAKLMPHYHLSLQSGCDEILSAMRRKYNTKQFDRVIGLLSENIPNVTFTTDIIVGFPGETEEMFEKTCEYVRKCGFLYVHIFPYSDRTGTDASKMKGKLSEQVKKDRAARLKNVMLETRAEVLKKYLGGEAEVLVETIENGIASGHTENFIEVRFCVPSECDVRKNDAVKVKLIAPSEDLEYVNGSIVQYREA